MSNRQLLPSAMLRAGRRRLRYPERWCRGAGAVDADNAPAWPWSPAAVRFCMEGALIAQHGVLWPGRNDGVAYAVLYYLTRAVQEVRPHSCVAEFNDDPETTHAMMLAVYDRAIDLAELEEVRP